jgi:hypothetical protein
MLVFINFASNKCFGLVNIGQMGLKGNVSGGEREGLTAIRPTIHRASFHVFIIGFIKILLNISIYVKGFVSEMEALKLLNFGLP